jgi:hypothetical protein
MSANSTVFGAGAVEAVSAAASGAMSSRKANGTARVASFMRVSFGKGLVDYPSYNETRMAGTTNCPI